MHAMVPIASFGEEGPGFEREQHGTDRVPEAQGQMPAVLSKQPPAHCVGQLRQRSLRYVAEMALLTWLKADASTYPG